MSFAHRACVIIVEVGLVITIRKLASKLAKKIMGAVIVADNSIETIMAR